MNYLALFLLGLCWLVPEHFPPWTAFHTEAPAFAATVLCAFQLVNQPPCFARIKGLLAMWIVLFGVGLVQLANGVTLYLGDMWVGFAYVGAFTIAWIWARQWTMQAGIERITAVLAYFFLWVGVCTAFQLLAQWYQIESQLDGWVLDGIPNGRPRANLGQPNQAGTTIVVATLAVVFLYVKRRLQLITFWVLSLLLIPALAVTQSRTATLSAIVAITVLCFAARKSSIRRMHWFNLCAWSSLFLITTQWVASSNVNEHAISDSFANFSSAGARLLIWKQILVGIWDRPLWGWGWGGIAAAQQFGALIFPGVEQTNYAHNSILDIFVTIGMPGALFLIFTAIVGFCRIKKNILGNSNAKWMLIFLLPIIIHSMLEMPHSYSYFVVFSGIVMGVITSVPEVAGGQSAKLLRHRIRWGILFLIWSSFLLILGRDYWYAEEDFRVNRFENKRIGPVLENYQPPKFILLTQLQAVMDGMRIRARQNMSYSELELLQKVSTRYTWGPFQYRAALALGLNGYPDLAARKLMTIKALFPSDIFLEACANFQIQVPVHLATDAVCKK